MVYSRPSLPISTAAIGTQEDVNRWPHLKGIDVPRIEAEIGLLIGSDVPQAMQPKEVRESKNGGPFAMRTVLGWMLSGPLGRKETKLPTSNLIDTTANLSKQFEDFCNLEFNDSSYEPKMSMSQNDQRALNIMEGTLKLSNGHYGIGLPWQNNPPHLENNRSHAENRLQMLKKRLKKDAILREKYTDFMEDLPQKSYAAEGEVVPAPSSRISPSEARQGPSGIRLFC